MCLLLDAHVYLHTCAFEPLYHYTWHQRFKSWKGRHLAGNIPVTGLISALRRFEGRLQQWVWKEMKKRDPSSIASESNLDALLIGNARCRIWWLCEGAHSWISYYHVAMRWHPSVAIQWSNVMLLQFSNFQHTVFGHLRFRNAAVDAACHCTFDSVARKQLHVLHHFLHWCCIWALYLNHCISLLCGFHVRIMVWSIAFQFHCLNHHASVSKPNPWNPNAKKRHLITRKSTSIYIYISIYISMYIYIYVYIHIYLYIDIFIDRYLYI